MQPLLLDILTVTGFHQEKTPGNARRQPTENLQPATIGESPVRLLCPQTDSSQG